MSSDLPSLVCQPPPWERKRTAAATARRLEIDRAKQRTPAVGAAGLGKRLRVARLARGLTAAQLAEKARLSQQTIVKLEAGGGWTGRTVEALAAALMIDPGELAGWPLPK